MWPDVSPRSSKRPRSECGARIQGIRRACLPGLLRLRDRSRRGRWASDLSGAERRRGALRRALDSGCIATPPPLLKTSGCQARSSGRLSIARRLCLPSARGQGRVIRRNEGRALGHGRRGRAAVSWPFGRSRPLAASISPALRSTRNPVTAAESHWVSGSRWIPTRFRATGRTRRLPDD